MLNYSRPMLASLLLLSVACQDVPDDGATTAPVLEVTPTEEIGVTDPVITASEAAVTETEVPSTASDSQESPSPELTTTPEAATPSSVASTTSLPSATASLEGQTATTALGTATPDVTPTASSIPTASVVPTATPELGTPIHATPSMANMTPTASDNPVVITPTPVATPTFGTETEDLQTPTVDPSTPEPTAEPTPADQDGDGYDADVDCNDLVAEINPGAEEQCNQVDDNCDEVVDEEVQLTLYLDADQDGYGTDSVTLLGCEAPEGYVLVAEDCNDGATSINPDADEICDGLDNDCNDLVDDADDVLNPPTWYVDQDQDGYGDGEQESVEACGPIEGYSLEMGDCDDLSDVYYPGAEESDCADPNDYNCDGQVGYSDVDGDGVAACNDCDDENASAAPGLEEVCDSIDNDCDESTDEGVTTTYYVDGDGDDFGDGAQPTEACELPDGYSLEAEDCNDDNISAYPGAEEVCDGVDNDCNELVDEGVTTTFYLDEDGDGYGGTETIEACNLPDGYALSDNDCDDSDDDTSAGYPSCAFEVGGSSCADILYAGLSEGSGYYRIDVDGDEEGSEPEFDVYCDMETDGGGWTLMGTISGSDENHWNTEFGYWSDGETLGSLDNALEADYKSPAWNLMDTAISEVLFQRQYDGLVRGRTVLATECSKGTEHFSELFETRDQSLACSTEHIDVIESSSIGVHDASYSEGESYGLSGGETNGFCWFGEDTENNIFKGHLFWNQYPGTNCDRTGHLGGVGVYDKSSSQYELADITGTNWLSGTNYELTNINLFVRTLHPDDRDGDGQTIEEGDCNDRNPNIYVGTAECPFEVSGTSCAEILYAGESLGDGVYVIEGSGNDYEAYCDMSTDGGGWTLLGTISGGDSNSWNTEFGYWSNSSELGDLLDASTHDYKGPAWSEMDIAAGEVLFQRRYDGNIEGQSVLGQSCIEGATKFGDLFATRDQNLACEPADIKTLRSSSVGVNSNGYSEGQPDGLGGEDSNGFCWFGEDTNNNIFRGHLVWNQYPGKDCNQTGHLGGVGVYYDASSQFTEADITGTNWLNGVDYDLVDINLYVRTFPSDDRDNDGVRVEDGDCDDLNPNVVPGSSDCAYQVGGSSCLEVLEAGNSLGDAIYWLLPEGSDSVDAGHEAYCDMSTDGGGWTLMGTIAGGDAEHWNTEFDYWSDAELLGNLHNAFDADVKTADWVLQDVSASEVLFERRHENLIEGQVVLENTCLGGVSRFTDLFESRDESVACEASDMRVLTSSAIGVYNSTYAEGNAYGLGGSDTNGLCWFGQDNYNNVFRGHLVWNQYPGSDCQQTGHLGGIGLYYVNSSQFTQADISGTNWLSGQNYDEIDISLFVR